MRYDLKAVYNPLEKDVNFTWDSEPYIVKAKSIGVFPLFLADYAKKNITNEILFSQGKEITDSKRGEIELAVMSHSFEVIDKTKSEEKPKTEGGK
jgi:hypothetical protein